jgi:EsV-like protein
MVKCINCNNNALYNYKNEKGYKYCSSCKTDIMVNKSKKICKIIDCLKAATKDINNIKIYCTEHHETKIIKEEKPKKIATTKKCYNCNDKSATYNFKGESSKYCNECCKLLNFIIGNNHNEMRNCHNKLCEYIYDDGLDCISIATYGKNNIKIRCKIHKEDDLIKLNKDKKCNYDDCDKVPSFIIDNKNYCAEHKSEDAKALFQKCKLCNDRANFNYIDKKGALYCIKHKDDNMVDKRKKICIEDKCINYASYNFKNIKGPIYCYEHKKENMISNKVKLCKEDKCLIEAYFGTKENKKQYCVTHKTNNMYNYTSKKCEDCNLFEVKHDNTKCSYCNPNARQKTKEKEVYDFLKKNNIEFEYNKSTYKECGQYFPDFKIDCNTHFIVIECDEEQHKQYTKECEFSRMNNIYLYNGLPTIFIRFNPDDFKINNKRHQIKIKTKLNKLLELINKYKDIELKNCIELIYMYYNCDCINNCDYIHIKKFENECKLLNLEIF